MLAGPGRPSARLLKEHPYIRTRLWPDTTAPHGPARRPRTAPHDGPARPPYMAAIDTPMKCSENAAIVSVWNTSWNPNQRGDRSGRFVP